VMAVENLGLFLFLLSIVGVAVTRQLLLLMH
jgi:hypothetical protein